MREKTKTKSIDESPQSYDQGGWGSESLEVSDLDRVSLQSTSLHWSLLILVVSYLYEKLSKLL